MAKFTNIGFVAKSKKDPNKSYIQIGQDVTLKKGDFVQLFKPRQGKDQTEEKFNELLKWKLFDLVQISDE